MQALDKYYFKEKLYPLKTEFIIIITGYNCKRYLDKCASSILHLKYDRFKVVFIDDGSEDGTGYILKTRINWTFLKFGFTHAFFESHLDNVGAAKRRYDAIKKYATNPNHVILLMGMDDELTPDCLDKINKHYRRGKYMTYGNWKNQQGDMLPEGFLDFPKEVHQTRDYRKVKYRSTAPNTFKRFLFDNLTKDDFKFNGTWIKATTESNLMLSCLEMCGESRIGIIKDPIYIYNQGRTDSARRRFGSEYQDAVFNNVINRPKKDLYIKNKKQI